MDQQLKNFYLNGNECNKHFKLLKVLHKWLNWKPLPLAAQLQNLTAMYTDATTGSSFKLDSFFKKFVCYIFGFIADTCITFERNAVISIRKGSVGWIKGSEILR